MLSFKKATITTEDEQKDGILVILKDDDCKSVFPETVFVPYNEKVFYTRLGTGSAGTVTKEAEKLQKIFEEHSETMLEMMSVADLRLPSMDYVFFDEKLGILISFEQDENYSNPIYIRLIDPIEWLNSWDADKSIWIKSMLNRNISEELKNKLLASVL